MTGHHPPTHRFWSLPPQRQPELATRLATVTRASAVVLADDLGVTR
jgi:hypothetical protein